MLITCPGCRRPFTVPQIGYYTCPFCGGQVAISSPPTAPGRSEESKRKGRQGTAIAVALGIFVVIGAMSSSKRDPKGNASSHTPMPATTAHDSHDGAPTTSTATTECTAALSRLRSACPRAAPLLAGECRTSRGPVNALTVNIEPLRPGTVIHFGSLGPEWFMREDGTLITMNGPAASACDGLPDVPSYIGKELMTNAPRRGSTAKTYEGVYGPDGNYLHPDCSEFEIRIGRLYHRALWSDLDASEQRAVKAANRAVKRAGVKPKLAEAIYAKTMSVCIQAVTVQ